MNKHDLDLRAAFPEMPDDCRTALLFAARSVKEEKKMKRMTFRTVLIAALLIITTMTAALAATGALGWTDFFKTYYNVEVTKPAQDVLNATPEETWQVGPMTFTLRQLLCDGHLAMAATAIRTTDGSPALYCFDPFDSLGCNGENGVALSQRLGLDPETTYLDAAKQLNLPLYSPRAILDITGEYMDGEGMEDPLWNEDNTVTYFSMAALDLEKMQGIETLPAQMILRVYQIDLETGEPLEENTFREKIGIEIPVHGVIAEKDYVPAEPASHEGFALQSVHAEQTIAGIYLTAVFQADEATQEFFKTGTDDEKFDAMVDLFHYHWETAAEERFPLGISGTGLTDDSDFPILRLSDMITAEQMPGQLIMAYPDQKIILR